MKLNKYSLVLLGILLLVLFPFFNSYSWAASHSDSSNSGLLARAGSGESFGGGGFDVSSSSSSFSGGGSDFSFGSGGGSISGNPTVTCCIIIIIILIIIIDLIIKRRGGKGFIRYGGRNGMQVDSGFSDPGPSESETNYSNKSMNSDEIAAQFEKLKEIDPAFDQLKFKTYVKKVFMAVQDGWTNRDQKICRPFMSEDVYQSHQMQLDSMISNKIINKLENIVVGSTDFARIDLGDDYHTITMKIRAAMKDYKVKEDNPDQVIEGSRDQQPPFTEYWSFIRRSNLKTKIKDGIFDRKCPNCGAPIDVDVAGTCKYCNANVVNGDFDWVLSEIIQREEWEG